MSTFLLDVNVLIALTWPSHVHHEEAHRWMTREPRVWASCPLTQLGFVRVSSNPTIVRDAVSTTEALAVLRELVTREDHVFWSEGVSPALDRSGIFRLAMGYRQATDAYLLCLSAARGGKLATLDRRIRNLVPAELQIESVLEVIS